MNKMCHSSAHRETNSNSWVGMVVAQVLPTGPSRSPYKERFMCSQSHTSKEVGPTYLTVHVCLWLFVHFILMAATLYSASESLQGYSICLLKNKVDTCSSLASLLYKLAN